MDIDQGRDYLTIDDVKRHPIWKYNEDDDRLYAVIDKSDLIGDHYGLCIRSSFTSLSGDNFIGYIVGVKNVFTIAIYESNLIVYFNRNLPGDYTSSLDKLSKVRGKKFYVENFTPLQYVTDIDLDGFVNISGEFDLLKRPTNAERLEGLE